MNTKIIYIIMLLFVAATVCPAQNTYAPTSLRQWDSTFWDNDVFADTVPEFVLGHQWGASPLSKVNAALRTNVTNSNWGWLDPNSLQLMCKLGTDTTVRQYLTWGSPLITMGGSHPDSRYFLQPWYGLRWDPAENAGVDRQWQPRDAQSWPMTFGYKSHGTVPALPTDTNYRRFVLDTAAMDSNPQRVLDVAELRNYTSIHRDIDWNLYYKEAFIADSNGNHITFHDDTMDCRRLQLVINLRRTSETDTIRDSTPVLSVVVPYQMRWKDQDSSKPDDYMPKRLRMPFRYVPQGAAGSVDTLPHGRGLERTMHAIDIASEYVDSIVITRAMLPRHSDPGGPDITIVAEFRTDTIWEMRDVWGTPYPYRRPHILKNGIFKFPNPDKADSTLINIVVNSSGDTTRDSSQYNMRYHAIDSLGVTLWYHGTSPVALRSVMLVTPLTRRATSGWYDSSWHEAFAAHRTAMQQRFDTVQALSGHRVRALSFYLHDEFDMDHLWGMRYRCNFVDGRLTSETGYGGSRVVSGDDLSEYGRLKFHGFPSKFPWTAGATMPSRATAAPYLARTYVDEWNVDGNQPIPAPILSIKNGYRRTGTNAPYRGYETDIQTNVINHESWETIGLPLTGDYSLIKNYEVLIHSNNAGVGPAAMQEHSVYTHIWQNGDWYFARRRYFSSNFFYHLDPKFGFDKNMRPYVRYEKFRPLTAEEVRLGHGTQLNLGTRGFLYDKWKHEYAPAPLPDTFTNTAAGKLVYFDKYYPGYVTEDGTAWAWEDDSTVTADSVFFSDHLGSDYYTENDSIRIHPWAPLDSLAKQMELSRFISGTPASHVYVGRLSVRSETRWWHDLVTDTVTGGRRGPHESNASLFMKTRPVAWYAHGYKIWENGAMSRLRKWLTVSSDSSVAVQRWARTSPTDTTLRLETEPAGERLYDIVLLDTSETGLSDDNCVIAVTNRRTSPFLFNTSLTDSVEWIAGYEHDTLTRNSRPDLRYKQTGARRITLPFAYSVDPGKPYLLHIREMHPAADSLYAIDTIINWNSTLALFLRPGETRYLRVQRLPATDTVGSGYLAFNTQNKMIVYPVRRAGGGYGDSVRYHMVFHRRDTDPARNGPWTVYYRRSHAYHKDSLYRIEQMQWEPPVRLSRVTTAHLPFGNQWNPVERTRLSVQDTYAYLQSVPDTASHMRDCCCGFPSIVIRETVQDTPMIFVVYACEDMWATNQYANNNYFHIVENAFPDVSILNPAALEVNGKSLVVAYKDIGHDVPPGAADSPADTLGSLARYGTPVVNASAENRLFYAWSSAGQGIGIATKTSTQAWLPSDQSLAVVPMPTIPNIIVQPGGGSDTVHIEGGDALYPSLNVYSNLEQHQTTSTLVWEEGPAANRHIRYTRLRERPGTNGEIERLLPTFVELSYTTDTPPAIPVDPANRIAIVGGTSPGEQAELPVVVRSLQDSAMQIYIRDHDTSGTNGLFHYNHETVCWAEWVPSVNRSRIRYNHFIDMSGSGANELHYWWANTTGSTGGSSLFHPVLASGAVRMDSLTWQGVADDTLVTYADSMHILSGNVSDSALVANYSILPQSAYQQLRAHKQNSYAAYWTGLGEFASLSSQQIYLRRMPALPGSPAITYHYDVLRGKGAWPHVSLRQKEETGGLHTLRRSLQYSASDAPSLLFSAEQFYKEATDESTDETPDVQSAAPVTYCGFQTPAGSFTMRGLRGDTKQIIFTPVYQSLKTDDGSAGSACALQMAAMTSPVSGWVSDPFTVGSFEELKVLSMGLLRSEISLTIEAVESAAGARNKNHDPDTTAPAGARYSALLTLADADNNSYEDPLECRYYITEGDERYYRLRLQYHGSSSSVMREDTDIDPAAESYSKSASNTIQVINLRRGTAFAADTAARLHIYPNPSEGTVTILTTGILRQHPDHQALLTVTDALGSPLTTRTVRDGQVITLHGLAAGSYSVMLTAAGTQPNTVGATGFFVVVR